MPDTPYCNRDLLHIIYLGQPGFKLVKDKAQWGGRMEKGREKKREKHTHRLLRETEKEKK